MYYNFITRVLQAQGQNCTKVNDEIWKIEEGGRKMICIQDDMCYNKGEEIAPSDSGLQYLMELTTEEKRELIRMWKERNNVSEQKKIR